MQNQFIGGKQSRGLARKVTAMGTVGEMGQLMTVYEKNWTCADCSQENYASVPKCFRCKRKKPEGLDNFVSNPALDVVRSGGEIEWAETIDPTTYQVYYYNKRTNETQWERPVELGPAPTATGDSIIYNIIDIKCPFQLSLFIVLMGRLVWPR